jgi:recombination protein RecA
MTKTDPRKQVLETALKNIEKQFWKWAIMTLGKWSNLGLVNTFHSWSYMLDIILGWWYPEWRIVEIYWPESSWKTTLALHAIAEVQKRWHYAAFIDAEHALDPNYAKNLGVDIENLLLSQPDYWEQALQIAEELAKTWAVKLIVIDSVAALVPKAEVEWDMGDSYIGLQARMMSQWLRKLTSILAKTWTTAIFLNQIRSKIWVLFGNPETTTWWNALKFFATQRIEIRRWEKLEESKEQVWYKAKVKVVKNKIAPPFKSAEIIIRFNQWIDKIADIVEAALSLGLITRSWSYYTIGDKKVQGKENLYQLLREDSQFRQDLEHQIQQKIKAIRIWKEEIPEDLEETQKEE